MPFAKLPGIRGKVYFPEEKADELKKYDCQDCSMCQFCTDSRCRVCLSLKKSGAISQEYEECRKGVTKKLWR